MRGCHCHDPDKGFGRVGDVVLPSAETGEERAVGRVRAAGLLLALLLPSPERRLLSKGHGKIHTVVSECLPKNSWG